MQSTKDKKILIIGAGLGGLALAQGLACTGFNVTVYERDESPYSRAQGYRISIRSLGMHALSTLLTPEKLNRLSTAKIKDVGDGFTCANEKMETFFSISQGQDAAVQFLRSELRNLLQEGINIQWKKRLVTFEDNGDQVTAYFEDGSCATGDLLVACDGAGSLTRELLPSMYGSRLGSIPKVINTPRAIFGGQIDRTSEWDNLLPLNKTGLVRFLGPHSHDMGVCFSERVDRSPTVFWAFSEESENREAPWYQFDQSLACREHILDHCKQLMEMESWHVNLKKLVFSTSAEEIMAPWLVRTTRFPNFDRFPVVPTGRVTLLGDAAHAMPSDKGLGGNHVLEDARSLSTLLAASREAVEWQNLIGKYEKEMFARAKSAVQESEGAAQYFRKLRA